MLIAGYSSNSFLWRYARVVIVTTASVPRPRPLRERRAHASRCPIGTTHGALRHGDATQPIHIARVIAADRP
jgi:hypothetical protein